MWEQHSASTNCHTWQILCRILCICCKCSNFCSSVSSSDVSSNHSSPGVAKTEVFVFIKPSARSSKRATSRNTYQREWRVNLRAEAENQSIRLQRCPSGSELTLHFSFSLRNYSGHATPHSVVVQKSPPVVSLIIPSVLLPHQEISSTATENSETKQRQIFHLQRAASPSFRSFY